MDISIQIGGKAGQGIQSINSIIAKTFVRHGYYVFINQDAESRIRDGHNYDQRWISNDLVFAEADKVRY
jgi:2-oxoglutarate ferredoxin oxidoreductase subunit alpha